MVNLDNLEPIGRRPRGLDGTDLATSSWHLDRLVFDPQHTVGVPVSGQVWQSAATDRITAAPPALNELSAYQHRYYQVDFRPGQDSSEPDQPVSRPIVELDKAQTWSSELVDAEGNRTGYHTVMLDIDHPVRLVPSTTEGHYHLYIDVPVREAEYFEVLRHLALAGVIETGYYEASLARGGTHLRLPWVRKDLDAYKVDVGSDEVPPEFDKQKFDAARDGVGHAIPAELDKALRQSVNGEVAELSDEDKAAVAAYRETTSQLVRDLGYGDRSDDDDLLELELPESDTGAEVLYRGGYEDVVPAATPDVVSPADRLEHVRAAFSVRYDDQGETVKWDVEKYEVAYVDGVGVLRRRKNVKSQHPEA